MTCPEGFSGRLEGGRPCSANMYGIVAAGNRYTASAGKEILARGGNAVDAAVAATFVSFLGEIAFVHSGGSGLALLYDSRSEACKVFDFFSSGPGLGAWNPAAKDFTSLTVDFGSAQQEFHVGRASVAVPGNFFGLLELARQQGSLPMARLLEPAIRLAREGVILDSFQAQTIRILEPIYTYSPGIREIFCPKGYLIGESERLRIPALATTLEEFAEQGETYLRSGRLARALLEDQRSCGGMLTARDLADYGVEVRPPLRCHYRGTTVWLPSLPSSGGPLIGLALELLARLEIRTPERLPVLAEVMSAAGRCREEWDRWVEQRPWLDAPFELWEEESVQLRVAQIKQALEQRRPQHSPPEPPSHSSTTHISVIDSDGLAVSLTHTAGESAGYVVPGTGFIPNNMMGEADLHPRGFHLTRPGARIPTMMTPAILTNPRLGCLALGSGGSTRIRSAMLQIIQNLVDSGASLVEAIEAPRIHYEEGVLQAEPGLEERELACAEEFGYRVNRWQSPHLYFGGANAVALSPEGRMTGCGDPRRGGHCEKVLESG